MRALGRVAGCAAAALVVLSSGAEAGSVPLHRRPAEISPEAALKFYEHVKTLWEDAPAKFDRVHPLAGRLLASETVYEALLAKWEAHPARFDHNHECLWRLLYGDMIYHQLHPPTPSPTVTTTVGNGSPPGSETPNGGPSPGGGFPDNPPPGGDGPGNPPPGIHTATVPEPSAAALMASGLLLVAIAAARRRASGRWKPS
jgi:hypothetical protein